MVADENEYALGLNLAFQSYSGWPQPRIGGGWLDYFGNGRRMWNHCGWYSSRSGFLGLLLAAFC